MIVPITVLRIPTMNAMISDCCSPRMVNAK